ncbi:DUF4124 domain-containing protein [Shewanella sp. NIFS-20-20]|nr:DUF4124 domain-containing protein [Shewanella sp. NIFS-20-20]
MSFSSHAAIYKCMKEGKVSFSQTTCPQDSRQHEIEFQLGFAKVIDTDKLNTPKDPLLDLLNEQTLTKEKLLQLVDDEIFRLRQESAYYSILKSNELQKLERRRFWQKQEKNHPEYIEAQSQLEQHYGELIIKNQLVIRQLLQRRTFIADNTPQS